MDQFSYLGNADVNAIEELFLQYRKDPSLVDSSWRDFFKGFDFARTSFNGSGEQIPENVSKEFKVIGLINGYRQRGHLFTLTNPVRERRKHQPDLSLENFGLSAADLDSTFQAGSEIGIGPAKLSAIIDHLKQTYCQSIGVEYLYVRQPDIVKWLQERMERTRNTPAYNRAEKIDILKKVTRAVVFENFLHTKFVGQKRFSLEGAESIIPAMNSLMEKGADMGIKEYVIAMAHRGRLNVLTNIMKKPFVDVFTEFEGRPSEDAMFDGDVKYHMGYSSDQLSDNGHMVHMSLTPNPSHLETVAPVAEGIMRSKIDNHHKGDFSKACPVVIHGDAAIAGQGIVYEVVQMSQLEAYKTGGTVHFVINNQVGFTTNYLDARSSTYCTDVAKVVLSPVFHVNGDDVEALSFASELAMEFRQTFHRDVFIDVLCYRKHGHNEGDEPRFTQPLLYKAIAAHKNPKELYVEKLIAENPEFAAIAKEVESHFKAELEAELEKAKKAANVKMASYLQGDWAGVKMSSASDFDHSPDTSISKDLFLDLAEKITTLPGDKKFFSKIQKVFNDRKAMIKGDNYDWAMGELMAYASLLKEGHQVRFSGQDVERGTFSHRHAVVKVEDSEEEYTPLQHIGGPARFEIYNSLLSEYGVLGFEYGYAFATPNALTIWEAQFGDFFNGAQIIIDQYLTSAEYKWRRMNGLVVLLPHGYEGQGPEHSSARVERFLQACAEYNIQVVNCTTPAQQFHVLRRQLKRQFRKPLICFTPKKLLRYPACVSSIDDFTRGGFKEVLDDHTEASKVTRVALCSGKIYFEMVEHRKKEKLDHVAFVRIEQLYPFPKKQIEAVLKNYPKAKEYYFVQEEPENMGAWRFVDHQLRALNLRYVGREEAASPATGFAKRHNDENDEILKLIFSKSTQPK